jgi:hypothetical protein
MSGTMVRDSETTACESYERVCNVAMGATKLAQDEWRALCEGDTTMSTSVKDSDDEDFDEFGNFESASVSTNSTEASDWEVFEGFGESVSPFTHTAKPKDLFKHPVIFQLQLESESDTLLASDYDYETESGLIEGQGLAVPDNSRPDSITRLARMYGKFSLRANLPVLKQKTDDKVIPYDGSFTGGPSVPFKETPPRARQILQLKDDKKATRQEANAKTDGDELRFDEKLKVLAAGANEKIVAKLDALVFGFTASQPDGENVQQNSLQAKLFHLRECVQENKPAYEPTLPLASVQEGKQEMLDYACDGASPEHVCVQNEVQEMMVEERGVWAEEP